MKVSTSFTISDEVWKKVRIFAIEHNATVSSLLERALSSLVISQENTGICLGEGPQTFAYQLKTLVSANKSDLMVGLARAFINMGIGDRNKLEKCLKGANEGWKHPNRTGKESDAILYLLALAKDLSYPGI